MHKSSHRKYPVPEGNVRLIVDIKLDPGFSEFYDWTLEHNVPVIVLSSGMEPIIRALLSKLLGPKAQGIPIISNNVDIAPDGSWEIVFRDESRKPPARTRCPTLPILFRCLLYLPYLFGDYERIDVLDFGHDKSRAIRPYSALTSDNRPILVYCGDGVSDISAARETDLLFAKAGRDLIKHCVIEAIPFRSFDVVSLLPPSLCGLFTVVTLTSFSSFVHLMSFRCASGELTFRRLKILLGLLQN